MTQPENRRTDGADRTRVLPVGNQGDRSDPADSQVTAVHPVDRQDTLPGPTRSYAAPDPGPGPASGQPHGRPEQPRQTWQPDGPAAGPTAPAWSTRPVAVRRSDPFAAFLLVLAGLAAGVSLLVPWVPDGATGLELARTAVEQLGEGWTTVFDTGFWQPITVLGGGALLLLLGLLVLLPARAHRTLGLLALLVAGAVVAAVLVPLVDVDWQLDVLDLGFYFALGVAALGLLGALKALLTPPKLR